MRISTPYVRGARQALKNAEECRTDAQAEGMQRLLIFARRDTEHAVGMLHRLADLYMLEGNHPLALQVTERVINGHLAAIKANEEKSGGQDEEKSSRTA